MAVSMQGSQSLVIVCKDESQVVQAIQNAHVQGNQYGQGNFAYEGLWRAVSRLTTPFERGFDNIHIGEVHAPDRSQL